MASRAREAGGWLGVVFLLGFLFLPVVIMVPSSFGPSDSLAFPPPSLSLRWYQEALTNTHWTSSGWLSLRLAVSAALIAAGAGLLVGLVHLRFRRLGTGTRLLLLLPLLVPHVVLATGLFALELSTHTLEAIPLLLLAQATLGVPYATLLFITAADAFDPLLWPAAGSLGAAAPVIVRKVVLPVLAPTAVVAAVFAFQASWDEISLAALIGPGVPPTLPVRMYLYLIDQFTPIVGAVSTMLLGLSVIVGAAALVSERVAVARRAAIEPPDEVDVGASSDGLVWLAKKA